MPDENTVAFRGASREPADIDARLDSGPDSDLAPDLAPGPDPGLIAGLAHDILPPQARRWARFGTPAAASLAELHARRREIDGIGRRLAATAQSRRADDMAAVQRALRRLREAGLALLAEIARAAK